MNGIKERTKSNWKYMLFFAAISVLVATFAPRFVAQYMPASYYYHIEGQPKAEKDMYVAGDTAKVVICRRSLLATSGKNTMELSMVRLDQAMEVVTVVSRIANIEVGNETVIVPFVLPANLPEGTYLIRGTVEFVVDGVEKKVAFRATPFTVVARDD